MRVVVVVVLIVVVYEMVGWVDTAADAD